VYLLIYLVRYILHLLMKKIEIEMLLSTLTKQFIEVQGYMLNPFTIIFFNMYLSVIYIMKHQSQLLCNYQISLS
jgi:hypothetical protein